ncbi:MAG: hypothetical protein K2V38_08270 [Gemmataceae bacterium]|nr:hypothetical protein [Gemmataceae bacterium]
MTRKISVAAAAVVMGGLLGGCASGERPSLQSKFQDLNGNNSWPQRYSYPARESVLHPFEVQMNNAKVLDGVVNNLDFESGTDRLNGVGRDKLDRHARKMPAPDPRVFVQTSADVPYDPAAPEKTVQVRTELDQKRAQAVLSYLNTRPNTRGAAFEVVSIDIADPGTNAAGPANAMRGLNLQYRSTLQGSVGGQVQGIGGGQATNTIGVSGGGTGGIPAGGGAPVGTGVITR